MDFASNYEIGRTADFISSRGYTTVALQFPDELLKDATRVAKALRAELGKCVRLYVMADTAYGSCCVDEVGASHVDADLAVHYGHACCSPTSTLPALFVFGKSPIDVDVCTKSLHECLSTSNKHILVLFGLEFAHAVHTIKTKIMNKLAESDGPIPVPIFAEVACSSIDPSMVHQTGKEQHGSQDPMFGGRCMDLESDQSNKPKTDGSYSLGGLTWCMPAGHKMEQYLLFWIGSDNPAFTNVLLMFNSCDTVRYDAIENCLVKDINHHKRVLKRRYYLVERAKDANIVGIVVGTLGVAGHLHIVQQMKELLEGAGKKSYTLLMGRPTPAKLANFPECDVFIYVSCAQTALLDSKEFLSPVITPFEAMLAFQRGSQWTGEYVIEFRNLMSSSEVEVLKGKEEEEEARFSFIRGRYVDDGPEVNGEEQNERSVVLAEATRRALNLKTDDADSILFKGKAQSGAEFFSARSYRGLDMQYEDSLPQSVVIGRTGRASGYNDEKYEGAKNRDY